MPSHERRGYRRVSMELEIAFIEHDSLGQVQNSGASESGLFIKTDRPAQVGSAITVVIRAPHHPEPITLQGRVVRTVPPGGQHEPGMGVELTEIPPRQRSRLRNLLAASVPGATVLLVGREEHGRKSMASLLTSNGYRVLETADAQEALRLAGGATIALVDVETSGAEMTAVVPQLLTQCGWLRVVAVLDDSSGSVAVAAQRSGVFEVIAKPIVIDQLQTCLRRAVADNTASIAPPQIVAQSRPMERLLHNLQATADGDGVVLIRGETGAGKNLVARSLHAMSARAAEPFICADIAGGPKEVIESHLFGHEKGAFTGAVECHIGLVERAKHGTLFFDEIGELDSTAQQCLLRLIEDKTFAPLGGERTLCCNARIVAATHCDLEQKVRAGTFRRDLFCRMDVVQLDVPPLWERYEDHLELVRQLLAEICSRTGAPVPEVALSVLAQIRGYRWPGNVRQLRSVLEKALLASPQNCIENLPLPVDGGEASPRWFGAQPSAEERSVFFSKALADHVSEFEDYWIRQALLHTAGNTASAARLCRTSQTTFSRRMRRVQPLAPLVKTDLVQDGQVATGQDTSTTSRKQVLVIDDDPLLLRAVVRYYAHEGDCDVVTCSGPHEALAVIDRRHDFDLILCDCLMPVMSGVEFFAELKRRHPAQAHRCVLCTGGPSIDECQMPADVRFIYKPVDLHKLRDLFDTRLDTTCGGMDDGINRPI